MEGFNCTIVKVNRLQDFAHGIFIFKMYEQLSLISGFVNDLPLCLLGFFFFLPCLRDKDRNLKGLYSFDESDIAEYTIKYASNHSHD